MGVIVSDRNLSKCQAVSDAVELKKKIHDLCIRDFGIKDLDHIVRLKYAYGVDSCERKEKYIVEMHRCKDTMHRYSDELIANTRAANGIRMNSVRRCNLRLDYQDRAVVSCEMMIGKIQDIADFFWVDINKLRQYIEAIDHEIILLKGWIEYTNKIRNKLVQGNI